MNESHLDLHFQQGIPESAVNDSIALYDQAFGQKFSAAIPHRPRRLELLQATFQPQFAFVALDETSIVGLVGFQTTDGSLTSGIRATELLNRLGVTGGLRAIGVFGLYDRDPRPGELLMDGIAVHRSYRGRGIGGKLLDEIINYATTNNYQSVRLDVIDTNIGAKRLYERKGFIAEKTNHFPWLKWLIGFSGATTMIYRTNQKQSS